MPDLEKVVGDDRHTCMKEEYLGDKNKTTAGYRDAEHVPYRIVLLGARGQFYLSSHRFLVSRLSTRLSLFSHVPKLGKIFASGSPRIRTALPFLFYLHRIRAAIRYHHLVKRRVLGLFSLREG